MNLCSCSGPGPVLMGWLDTNVYDFPSWDIPQPQNRGSGRHWFNFIPGLMHCDSLCFVPGSPLPWVGKSPAKNIKRQNPNLRFLAGENWCNSIVLQKGHTDCTWLQQELWPNQWTFLLTTSLRDAPCSKAFLSRPIEMSVSTAELIGCGQ